MDQDNRLHRQYCSSTQPKSTKKDKDGSVLKQKGVSASTKSLQSSSSYDSSSLLDTGRTDSGFVSGSNLLPEEIKCSEDSTSSRDQYPPTDKSKEYQRSFTDSGFLSGTNLCSDSIELSQNLGLSDSSCMRGGIMRLDSGVAELDEKISGLSVSDPAYNDLGACSDLKSKSQNLCSNIILQNIDSNVSSHNQSVVQFSDEPSKLKPIETYFQQDEDGDTQLHIAILNRFIEVVYYLIKMVPNNEYLDFKNNNFQTSLHLAVLTEQHGYIHWLMEAGASPDLIDKNGNTPLHLAVINDSLPCIDALLSANKSKSYNSASFINKYNYDGLTCLHIAVINRNVEIVQRLLDRGADINAMEYKSGLRPLHLAVEMGNEQLCQFLLSYCQKTIDLEAESYAGLTPYMLASRANYKLAQFLRDNGAVWYPDDSEDEYEDDDEQDDDDDEMYEASSVTSFGIHCTNGMKSPVKV